MNSYEQNYLRVAPYSTAAIALLHFVQSFIGDAKHITADRHARFLALAKIAEAMLQRICILLLSHIKVSAPKPRKTKAQGFPEGLNLPQATGYRVQLLETPSKTSPASPAKAGADPSSPVCKFSNSKAPHGPLLRGIASHAIPDPCNPAQGIREEVEDLLPTSPLMLYLLDLEIALVNPIKTATKLKRKLAKQALEINSALLSQTKFKRLKHNLLFAGDAQTLKDLDTAARKALPLKYYPIVPYLNSS